MKKIYALVLSIIVSFSFTLVTTASAKADRDAATIFKKVCKMCHKKDKKKIGPALAGIGKRTTVEWEKKWIRNPQKMWEANEGYTKTLRANFKTGKKKKSTMGTTCPLLKKLTDNEVVIIAEEIHKW